MKLQLSNPDFNPQFKLRHTDTLFFIGSCFADTMSRYFRDRAFRTNQNPFGVLYNPISIANSLEDIAGKKKYKADAFYERDGMVSSWLHHSDMAAPTKNELQQKLNAINENFYQIIESSNVVFITLGTAWAYWLIELEMYVANNLKAPSALFEKRLLSIEEIASALHRMVKNLRVLNSNIKIVFTVSPVRHSKQGLIENNHSKARLLEAIHNYCAHDPSLTYFPSYELVIDVLRDYRFFEKDLVHPNELATDYVWEYLHENFIDSKDYSLYHELYKLHLATRHTVRHITSDGFKNFKKEQLAIIKKLHQEYPYLDLTDVQKHFEGL